MQIGMIGLGRMGANMVRRLLRGGHTAVVFDPDHAAVQKLVAEGAIGAASLDEFVAKLEAPKTAWCMVPAGEITENTVRELGARLGKGDAIIDGGNTYFKDDVRRSKELAPKGIAYLDVGTSGGVWGLERGYCLMVGAPADQFARLEPIFKTLAPGKGTIDVTPGIDKASHVPASAQEGYLHCGPAGAGHFVKMVHNGIEYGLMQAFAEGFDLMRSANKDGVPEGQKYDFNVAGIAEVWRRGSVVASWLLDLTSAALAESPTLDRFTGHVSDSGEGRWTIQTALETAVPVPVLAESLFARFRSRQDHTFGDKLLSAMREQFGGHRETK
ncbi:MAG: phosphogluconate dehydrogenase (NAD(+)-dependent, decarboxylating) [Vicinamibacteraceae bacterium]